MVTTSEAIDMECIGGILVEILNLVLLLGYRGGWSVCSPDWRKISIQKNLLIISLSSSHPEEKYLRI